MTIDTLVVPVNGTRAFLRASLARFLILDVVLLVLNFGTERWYFTVFILHLYIIIYLFCSIPLHHVLLLMRSRRSHLIHDEVLVLSTLKMWMVRNAGGLLLVQREGCSLVGVFQEASGGAMLEVLRVTAIRYALFAA